MLPHIVALDAEDAAQIEAHLLRLSPQDRSLRFAAGLVTDETIRRHVASLRFDRDAVFGLRGADGSIVGLAHGCVYVVAGQTRIETAFSIDVEQRGRGLGALLMAAIEVFATGIAAQSLVGTCAARNLPMRRVFERAGMALTREDDEMHAFRRVERDTDAAQASPEERAGARQHLQTA